MNLLAAVAVAFSLPSGWMAVPAPNQQTLECAQNARRFWSVSTSGGQVHIAPRRWLVRDALPFVPNVPGSAISERGDWGDRHVLKVDDGWLVGFDDGEWDGSLWWFSRDGSLSDKLFGHDAAAWTTFAGNAAVNSDATQMYPRAGNVRAIVRTHDGVVALTGVAHMTVDEGGALSVTRVGGRWQIAPLAQLDGMPKAYAVENPNTLLVLTNNGISRLSVKKGVAPLTAFEHYSLGVDSLARGNGGALFVGMQQYVVQLTPAKDVYRARWYAPNDCPIFGGRDANDCRCVGAAGTPAYAARMTGRNPNPQVIAAGPDGNVWFSEATSDRIGRISPAGTIIEFPAGGRNVSDLVAGGRASLWLSASNTTLARIAADGVIADVTLPTVAGWSQTIGALTPGLDGSLWFVENGSTRIAHLTADGALKDYPLPVPQFERVDAVATSDGAVWFTAENADQVGVLTAAGETRLYAVHTLGSGPIAPVLGPGGAIWFLEAISGNLATVAPDGRVTEVPVFPQSGSGAALVAGAAGHFVYGPDGNFWLTEPDVDTIVKITPGGAAFAFATAKGSRPLEIATGADGNLWFTENGSGKIGRVTPAGAITEFTLPPFTIVQYL